MHRLEGIAVGVEDEAGVVRRAIVRAQARTTIVAPACRQRRPVKGVDGGAVGRIEGQMKARARRVGAVAAFYGEFVAAAGHAVASRVRAGPHPHHAEGCERGIVEGERAPEVGDAEGNMAEHLEASMSRRGCRLRSFLCETPEVERRLQHSRALGPGRPNGYLSVMPASRFLSRLRLSAFRNYQTGALDLDSRHVVLVGANGAGKTNLLEAISLLSPGRGLRRAA